MQQPQAHADLSEVPFGFEELFFSRTDPAGIIKFGNGVFQRISGYAWEELNDKPHKIIRHPDTPRAVFWALWDSLKRGEPIGAYVKNRAKDGRHYWVFAIATPVEGGYLSVRLRPSSELLGVVKQEYAALVEVERRERPTPADSAGLLLSRLRELGYPNYPAFMAAALGAELAARDKHCGRAPDADALRFEALLGSARTLLQQAGLISQANDLNEYVPFNFRVLAAQLGDAGAAVGVISANYSRLAVEMKAVLDQFIAGAENVFQTVNSGYFLASTARVQREMAALFRAEGGVSHPEAAALDMQQRDYAARALAGLDEIERNARQFQRTRLDLERLGAGLDVTRIMGKVECARHIRLKGQLDELLGDLERYQQTVAAALKEIGAMNAEIVSGSVRLLETTKAAA